jgi:hypothetical protein
MRDFCGLWCFYLPSSVRKDPRVGPRNHLGLVMMESAVHLLFVAAVAAHPATLPLLTACPSALLLAPAAPLRAALTSADATAPPPLLLSPRQLLAPLHRARAPRAAIVEGIEFAFEEDEEDDEDTFDSIADDPTTALSAVLTDQPAVNLTVSELQAQLKQLGQRATGTKAQLIERVQLMQRKRALGLPIHDMQVQREEDMRWYMLQTANGFEGAVERNINMMIKAQRLASKIKRVWVPMLEGGTSVRPSAALPSDLPSHKYPISSHPPTLPHLLAPTSPRRRCVSRR